MTENEKILDFLTDIRIKQEVQGHELHSISETSRDTNNRIGNLEKDVAVLNDARKVAAEAETKVIPPAGEGKRGRAGIYAIWIAVISGVGALLSQMIGCFQTILETTP